MADPKARPLKFAEAIDALRRRLNIGGAEWNALARGMALAAGDTAHATSDTMIDDMIAAVIEIMDSGGTLADFQNSYDEITARDGWTSPKGAAWHSELVFRIHTGMARAAGRWVQAQRIIAANPQTRYYFRYVTAGDHRVRKTHRLWHGAILPVDHKFWLTHWPPNGFNCRCHIMLVSDREIARFKWTLTNPADPLLSIPPDDGWSGNVGLAAVAG